MKHCQKCGLLIEDDDVYCYKCGYKNSDDNNSDTSFSDNMNNTNNEPSAVNLMKPSDNIDNEPAALNLAKTSYNSDSAFSYSIEEPKKISLLCIIGFILTFFGGGIISLILCIIGVAEFDEKKQTGKGFGIAGIIINSVMIALAVIVFFIIICLGNAIADELLWIENFIAL